MLTNRLYIRILIHEDTFFVDDMVLLDDSLQLQPLIKAFDDREIAAIQIDAGVEPQELSHLIDVVNLDPKELQRLGGPAAVLEERSVPHIHLGALSSAEMSMGSAGVGLKGGGLDVGAGLDAQAGREEKGSQSTVYQKIAKIDPNDAYRAALRVRDELSYQASTDEVLSLQKADVIVKSFIDIIAEDNTALPGIVIMKTHDEDTYHHSVIVCILSLLIGSRLKLSRELLSILGLAALLHDIGKVRIPQALLTKTGKLTPEELDTIRRHTVYGAHALRELPGLARLSMVVAFEHHANYNLSGYPRIATKRIPNLLTRIVQVADVYDAMTSTRRAYRRALLRDEALKVISKGAGTLFDPVVVKSFLQVQADLARKNAGQRSGAA
jgi:putative nucleotidyltransferase with HDIG domain